MIYLSCDNMKKIIFMISIFFIGLNFIYARELVKYADCVDGDTIKVFIDDKEEIVRLLAIDTPESVKPNSEVEYYGKEASNYTCNRIKKAKKIELEYDSKSDKRDKFDRVLAWVFLDGELLQTSLVANGYAKVAYLYDDYKYNDILIKKQELASAKGIGIWNESAKLKYEQNTITSSEEDIDIDNNYENIEVIIITGLLLIFVLISKKLFK